MSEGIFALAGVVVGAVLGIAGTALTERWRHSYIRNDARSDRYAATLREALEAYAEFVHAWTPLADQIAQGKPVTMVDPDVLTGLPGLTHRRIAAVIERIHIESIRQGLNQLVVSVVTSVADGKVNVATIDAWTVLGSQLNADIGSELRKLEAQ
jgi:hypothetical protein